MALVTDAVRPLSEVSGLMIDDIKLESPLPYLHMRPHLQGLLNTASNERKIPLFEQPS